MEYKIAQESDLDGIMKLYAQLDPNNSSYDLKDALNTWHKILKTESIRYFVARDNGRIVGTCSISIIPNLTKGVRPFAVIENVITDAEYRKMGIGKSIMNMAVKFAKENNCYKVQLLSGITRTDAHIFYEKIGFSGNSKKGYELRFETSN
jgi:ribosomal protein S18 acetylase RimI-like enzyme